MIYIVVRNSLGGEINRVETDEASLTDDLIVLARENVWAVGDVITIEEA